LKRKKKTTGGKAIKALNLKGSGGSKWEGGQRGNCVAQGSSICRRGLD